MRKRAKIAAALGVLLLAGCNTWFGESDGPPLPGQRISVLEHQQALTADPQAGAEPIVLPPPIVNSDWPQAGGDASHAMQHLQANLSARPIWEASAGTGVSSSRPILAPPVIGGGRIYTIDTENLVSAFELKTGKRLWDVDLARKEEDDDARPGGIAYDDGRLFASTGFGKVVALDAARGKELWRRSVGYPVHSPPTVAGGRVFVVSVENQLRALSAADGSDAWPPFQALAEVARLVGGASPAVDAGAVVAPFSSGELVALRADTGRPIWTESLAPARSSDEISALAQIRARPVIDGGRVYAISAGGILAAFDLRTGQRLWERDVGGLQSPWLAGRHIFQITSDGKLIAVAADNGRIHWVTPLPAFEDEKEREGPVQWAGPVLASERLLIASSDGRIYAVSPFDGRILDRRTLGRGTTVAPVVAEGAVFLLDDDGGLFAFR